MTFCEQVTLMDNPEYRAERDALGRGGRLSLRFIRPRFKLAADWRCVMAGSYEWGARAPFNFVVTFGDFDGGNAIQREETKNGAAYRVQLYGAWQKYDWPEHLAEDELSIVREFHDVSTRTLFLATTHGRTKQRTLFI